MYEQNDEIQKLREEILRLKDERCALILSHCYQRPEIQDIADYVGDSLELSRTAAKTDKKVIVFCGVHFMAESAAILSPDKTVLIPDVTAGCPMADMVTREALIAKKKEMQDVTVVTYVNSSAEVKAESDICCTSANVVKVVESVPKERKILFVPDRNLGSYASLKADRDIELWDGYCYVHDNLTAEDVKAAKKKHPDAKLLVHPECNPEVIEMADCVASTSGMLRFAKESSASEFLIATEEGILHQFRKQNPDKKFYIVHEKLLCVDMKKINLHKLKKCLEDLQPRVQVSEEIRKKALLSLERMIRS